MKHILFSGIMGFEYGQFCVNDDGAEAAFDWTQQHVQQGFARSDGAVSFSTVLEFGRAYLHVSCLSPAASLSFDRVVAVPFESVSGHILISSPADTLTMQRRVDIPVGHYRLICGQSVIDDCVEFVFLQFERLETPLGGSEILVRDFDLTAKPPFLEYCPQV